MLCDVKGFLFISVARSRGTIYYNSFFDKVIFYSSSILKLTSLENTCIIIIMLLNESLCIILLRENTMSMED